MTDTERAEKREKKALKKARRLARQAVIDKHRIHFAVYHCLFVSDLITDISDAVGVETEVIAAWAESEQWEASAKFFLNQEVVNYVRPVWNEYEREQIQNERRSLRSAAQKWKRLVREGEDIRPDPNSSIVRREDTRPSEVFDVEPEPMQSLLDAPKPVKKWAFFHRVVYFLLTTLPMFFIGGE